MLHLQCSALHDLAQVLRPAHEVAGIASCCEQLLSMRGV